MTVTVTRIVARYAETDQMGVIHHSVYPVWFEAARTEFTRTALGLRYGELEALGVMTPLSKLECHYRAPSHYEDELDVETRVSVLTPARIEFSYAVRRAGEPAVLCSGSTLHGWVDTKTFRPLNMKKRFPELYEKMEHWVEE